MNRQDIANVLKDRRKELKISIAEVIEYLLQNGFDVKSSTIYGWENGRRTPDIDQFVILCRLYGIENFTDAFLPSVVTDSSCLSKSEQELLDAFRLLSAEGQEYIMQTIDIAKAKFHNESTISKFKDSGNTHTAFVAARGKGGQHIKLTPEMEEELDRLESSPASSDDVTDL